MIALKGPLLCRATWSAGVIVVASALFYVAGLRATHGVWPAPLDDVYIHYDFARSAASGHPFTWIASNGYSSGGTSLFYPLLLGVGYLVGFHGSSLGIVAAVIAVVSLVDVALSIASLIARRVVALAAPLVLVAIPLLDWTWFSGMEVAFAAALLARGLASAHRAAVTARPNRARHELRAGLYLAVLAVTRPECVVLAPLLAVFVVGWRGAHRMVGPTVVTLAVQAVVNRLLTGEAASAGTVRKLLIENPYFSKSDVAVRATKNLAELLKIGVNGALGGWLGSAALVALAICACVDRRSRALALALVCGALGVLALVSLNVTATFQNMRYVAPSLFMLGVVALLGLDALVRKGGRARLAAIVASAAFLVPAASTFPHQVEHFARASQNILEQHVEVGRRLAALPVRPRRVLVGDAGAIPYVSGLPALDGFGLGGFHELPFARASVHGTPAVIELIERMPPDTRPDVLAIYDSWWPDIGSVFGELMFEVTIEGNVICGDPTKRVYRADWTLLEDRLEASLDRLDVGDLVDERLHDYEFPHPHGGYVISNVLMTMAGKRTFDAGRIIPKGRDERFTLKGSFPRGAHALIITSDDESSRALDVHINEGAAVPVRLLGAHEGAWSRTFAFFENLGPDDEVRVRPTDGDLRSFAYVLE